jgi:GH15 family glucan-1,4-alpha-glucosidase
MTQRDAITTSTAARPEAPECDDVVSDIGDYGLVGDCRTAALISGRGSIDWLCLPNFSGPAVFARLLDPEGGRCLICPKGAFRSERHYRGHTPVLETTFTTDAGTARLIDAMPVLEGLSPMRPMREFLRIVEGREGSVTMDIVVDPRPGYARVKPRLRHRGSLGWTYEWGDEVLVVRSDVPLTAVGGKLRGTIRCSPGSQNVLSLSYVKGDMAVFPTLGASASRRVGETEAWWNRWDDCYTYEGPYRDAVLRSVLALKLLTYALSGAMVAAPTTSLPESPGDDRNWDYRYCWLRDAGLTVQALVGTGFVDDARHYLGWLLHATRLTWPELRVVYDLYGHTRLRELELDHFRGFLDSRPVRIGNGAYDQLQLDIYGNVILAADSTVAAGDTLDGIEARVLSGLARTVRRLWREPDSGIWEIRGPRRQYTFSKLMCWVALDRLLDLERRGAFSLGKTSPAISAERDRIRDLIEERAYNRELASYTSELDGNGVSAELLLLGLVGFKDPRDPRMQSTHRRIVARLAKGPLLFRYEHGYDGMPSPEGAFGICSFWNVQFLAEAGEVDAAERNFEQLLSFANDLGLYAEEIDPADGRALGNFPQAFTHVGLINAALAIKRARDAGAA